MEDNVGEKVDIRMTHVINIHFWDHVQFLANGWHDP
jgi:hypothetical protein